MPQDGSLKIINPAISSKVGTGSGIDILQLFLTNFISLALGAAGIISFFMLLWGGISYIMAGGEKEATQNASKRITAALIGLALVFSIFAIIYVVETIFGISITQFKIPIIQWKEVSILNKLITAIKFGSALATVLAVSPAAALADERDINLTQIDTKWQDLSNITVNKVLIFAINGILIVSGIISFFFLLIGGVQWILAGGDKEGTEKARKRITAALIGLAIVFSAYALATLVRAVFGVDILNFRIPSILGGA